MKTYWKWIIGVVVVLAVIAAAMFGMHYLVSTGAIKLPAWHGPMMGHAFNGPRGFDGSDGQGKGGGFDGGRYGPMTLAPGASAGVGGRGHGHFGPFMFIGGLIRLIIFAALLYGAYWLGKRNARIVYDTAPVAPANQPMDETPKPRNRKVAKS